MHIKSDLEFMRYSLQYQKIKAAMMDVNEAGHFHEALAIQSENLRLDLIIMFSS